MVLSSCNAVKRLEADEHLLTENTIYQNDEKVSDPRIRNQLYQNPNVKLLGVPLRLHIYNMARPNIDSILTSRIYDNPKKLKFLKKFWSEKQIIKRIDAGINFNEWIKRTGQAPTIINEEKTNKSKNRLEAWYWNNGWFNVDSKYEINLEDNKRGTVDYFITTGKPYIVDSISRKIESPVVDSLYQAHKGKSLIKSGVQYATKDFGNERDRLTTLFRNSGLYHFEQEFLNFDADTVNTNHKVNVNVLIGDRPVKLGDTAIKVPFKIHKISEVNIITDYTYQNRNKPITDTTSYDGYNLMAFDEIKYRPKSLTDNIFIKKGDVFKDIDRTLTYNRISQLRIFKYPNIKYVEDPRDSTNTNLIANVFLTPREKYNVAFNFDVSQSNIQDFGIGFGGSLLIRNIFRGAETFEISTRGSIGSSSDAADSEDRFFNISEVGADMKLSFPKILFPINTEKYIPNYMSPFTTLSVGVSTQQNIGLDKQNVTGAFSYRWQPKKTLTHQLDLLNVQYVRNLNTGNYFNVYRNSFNILNDIAQNNNDVNPAYFNTNEDGTSTLIIPEGANSFINDALSNNIDNLTTDELQDINNINERQDRLTEDNLIFASNFSYVYDNRDNLYDNDFSRFRGKIEFAGNTLSTIASSIGLEENNTGGYNIFGVRFSQYAKLELDYIKHWDWGNKNIFAIRTFGGIAIPYGNSESIPFSRSFFAGGTNDNRGWQAYDLGPGSTGGRNEFNEANMKLHFSGEYRFNLFGQLNSALFVDVGNIWNVLDNVDDEDARFTSLSDLSELAVGSGFGLRYDVNFFVIRFDIGFKTYNPALTEGDRWFKQYNFANAVYNVGINYPF